MLAGLPIVATRVSAVPEVVVDGETGLLVEAGDDDGLAEALESLLADPERAASLGEAGRQRALTEFSVARMAERTLARLRRGAGLDRRDDVEVRGQRPLPRLAEQRNAAVERGRRPVQQPDRSTCQASACARRNATSV